MEVSFQERSTLCCGGAAPLPVKVSAAEFEALLVNEPVAEALPDTCGANVSVNGTLCPAAIVSGKVIPLSENSALLTAAEDSVTLDPMALSVPAWVLLVPTVTLPKSVDVGVTANWPCAIPVPTRDIVIVEFEALEPMEMLPLALPPDWGANVVPKVTL